MRATFVGIAISILLCGSLRAASPTQNFSGGIFRPSWGYEDALRFSDAKVGFVPVTYLGTNQLYGRPPVTAWFDIAPEHRGLKGPKILLPAADILPETNPDGSRLQTAFQHQWFSLTVFGALSFAALISTAFAFKGNRKSKELKRLLDIGRENFIAQNQEILDNHAIISVTDLEGNIIFANELFSEISGYSNSELLGRNHSIMKSGFHKESFYEDLWDTIASGAIWSGNILNRAKNGREYWVKSTIAPLLDAQGKPFRYFAIRTDISKEARAQEHAQLAASIEALDDEIYIYDPDSLRLLYVNQKVKSKFRISEKDMMEMTPLDFVLGFTESELRKYHEPLDSGKQNFVRYERLLNRINGETLWMEIKTQLVAPVGAKKRFICVLRDVTAERAMQGQFDLVKSTLDHINTEIYIVSPLTHDVLFLNQSARRETGWDRNEVLGRTIAEVNKAFKVQNKFFTPNQFEEVAQSLVNGDVESYKYEFVGRDGLDFELTAQYISPPEGIPQIFVSIDNISERRKTEKEVRNFLLTLDSIHNEVYMFWPDTLQFFYVNKAAVRTLGWTRSEFMKMTPLDFKSEFNETSFRRLLQSLIDGDTKSMRFATVHKKRSGSTLPVEVFLQYLESFDEKPRFIAIARDMTLQREVDRQKSEFVSTISHELRTPLTAVSGALGILASGKYGHFPVRAENMIKTAKRNAKKLGTLLDEILDQDKMEFGKFDISMDAIDISDVLSTAVHNNQTIASQYMVNIVLTGIDTPVLVLGNSFRLEQVISNLLSNAAKFSREGQTIFVSLERRKNTCLISVTDEGIGIPEAYHDAIFERYTQVDKSDSRLRGGTGLGLNISKLIIEKHQGRISLSSKEGEGSTFYIELPFFVETKGDGLAN